MALLGLAAGGAISVVGFMQIHRLYDGQLELTHLEKVSLWFISISWMMIGLVSIVGLIGSLAKARGCINFYASTVTVNTILNIGAGIFFVWTLFRHSQKDTAVDRCVDGTDGDAGKVKHWVCDKGFHILRVVLVIIFVIVWIFQLVGIFIVFDYRGQLKEEAELKDEESHKGAPTFVISAPSATGAPAMRTTYDAAPYDASANPNQGGWASAKSPYAFNLPENAHGGKP
jgi:hypothetical protein